MSDIRAGSPDREDILAIRDQSSRADTDVSTPNPASLLGRLSQGDVIEVILPAYSLADAQDPVYFIKRQSHYDQGQKWLIRYVHDRSTDSPVADFPQNESWAGVAPVEALECLTRSLATTGAHPTLDALLTDMLDHRYPFGFGIVEACAADSEQDAVEE